MKKLMLILTLCLMMTGMAFASIPNPDQWRWIQSTATDSLYQSKAAPTGSSDGRSTFVAASLFILTHPDNTFTVYNTQIYSNKPANDYRIRFLTVARYDANGQAVSSQNNPNASWQTFRQNSMEANMFYAVCHEVAKYNPNIQTPYAIHNEQERAKMAASYGI